MTFAATPELFWLTLTIVLTGISSFPYVGEILSTHGVKTAIAEGCGPPPNRAAWALRARRAHANAVENLVLFAPLGLTIVVMEQENKTTALACAVYYFARVAHHIVFLLGVGYVRTLLFGISLAAVGVLVVRLFGY